MEEAFRLLAEHLDSQPNGLAEDKQEEHQDILPNGMVEDLLSCCSLASLLLLSDFACTKTNSASFVLLLRYYY